MTASSFTEWFWAVAGLLAFMGLPFIVVIFVCYLRYLFGAFLGSKDDEL